MNEDQEDPSYAPTVEVGNSGLNRVDGWVEEEWLKDLRGRKGIRKYKEMRDNCSTVGAILFAIEMLVRQARFFVEPASDNDTDKEVATFLEQCLFEDMEQTWQETLADILSMLPFGWALHEMVFKKRLGDTGVRETQSNFEDGRIGFRKISIRAQETFWKWEFDDDNNLLGMWQQSPPNYDLVFIPIEKCLLFRYKTHKNNPEGVSILRNAFESYFYKSKIMKIEGIGIERDLAGLPMATVPLDLLSPTATKEQKASLKGIKKIVVGLRRDIVDGVVFPAAKNSEGKETGYSLSLLSTGSRRQFDTDKIITRYEQRIAQTVAADFIFLGQTGAGSYALSTDKTDLFGLAIGTILDVICDVFNNKAIPLLFKLNAFAGLSGLPKLKHDKIEPADITKLATFIQALSTAGAELFPNDALLNQLLEMAGLPQLDDDTIKARAKQREQDEKNAEAQLEAQINAAKNPQPQPNNQNPANSSQNGTQQAENEAVNKMYVSITKSDETLMKKLRKNFQGDLEDDLDDNLKVFIQKAEEIGVAEKILDYIQTHDFTSASIMQTLSDGLSKFYGVGWNGGWGNISKAAEKAEVTVTMDSMVGSQMIADYAETRADQLIKGLTDTTKGFVYKTISDGIVDEKPWEDIKDDLKKNYAFSSSRAETIARTESAVAYNTGYAKVGKESGCVKSLMVTDEANCGRPICTEANGEKPLEWLAEHPIGHPNCTRDATYVFDFGKFRSVDDDE